MICNNSIRYRIWKVEKNEPSDVVSKLIHWVAWDNARDCLL